MSGRVLLLALGQVGMFWLVGAAVVHLLRPIVSPRARLDAVERAVLAPTAFVLLSVALMVVHALSDGRVFSNRIVVPAVLATLLLAAFRRGFLAGASAAARFDRGAHRALVAALAAMLVLLYVVPVLIAGSSGRTGDPPWHLGWTEQVLDGQRLPVGPAPEFGRNAYPWAYHGVLATMVRAVPSSDPLIAHEAMHLVLVFALPLGAAALARTLDRRAGLPAAIAMSLVGGWGWLEARAPAFFPRPRYAAVGADLAAASPNAVYEMFPPAIPREVGLVLLAAAGVTIVRAVAARTTVAFAVAGAAVGIAGVVSVPMFVAGLAWIVAALWWVPGIRIRAALAMVGAAGALLALWAAPVAWSYLTQGGFVEVSPRLGREWPLGTAFGSWGVLGPAALLGMLVAARRGSEGRAVLGFVAATSALLALAVARGAFGWELAGQATLLHQGRVWPVAHLLAAVLAAMAVLWVWDRGRAVSAATAAAVLGAAAAVGAVSPVLASAQLTTYMEEHRFGFVYSDPEIADPDAFVRRAAAHMDSDAVVRVEGSDELAFFLFQFSGARLAAYDDPDLEGNDLRIRYRRLADAWDERMRGAGFSADFVVRPADEPPSSGLAPLEEGSFRGRRWVLYSPGA